MKETHLPSTPGIANWNGDEHSEMTNIILFNFILKEIGYVS